MTSPSLCSESKAAKSGVGVDAPRSVAVHREEIYERIKAEQEAGAIESRDNAAIAFADSLCRQAPTIASSIQTDPKR